MPKINKKLAVLTTLLLVCVYLGLALSYKFWPFHKHVTITATSVSNSLPSKDTNSAVNKGSTSPKSTTPVDSSNPKQPSQSDDKTLSAPSGTFANLYNADANTQMNSICKTTPDASCQIIFTKGDLSIALPAKKADTDGVASWAWTSQQIGLYAGKWHVAAKAVLGSQTKTTDNGPLELVIQ